MPVLLQLIEQGSVSKVLLQIDRVGFVDEVDLGNGTAMAPEMTAEMDEGAVFPYIVVLCGDIGSFGRADTKIYPVAA